MEKLENSIDLLGNEEQPHAVMPQEDNYENTLKKVNKSVSCPRNVGEEIEPFEGIKELVAENYSHGSHKDLNNVNKNYSNF